MKSNPGRRAFLRGEFLGYGARTALGDHPPLGPGLAVLDESACMAWNGVVCMSCGPACPEQAIAVDERGRPRVSHDACSGCGECVGVCPPQAISIDG